MDAPSAIRPEYGTAVVVGRWLGVNPRWIPRQALRSYRPNGRLLFRLADVEALIRAAEVPAPDAAARAHIERRLAEIRARRETAA